jgi:hypothetical protein
MKARSLLVVVAFMIIVLSSSFAKNQPSSASPSTINNDRIIELSKLGLDDDIVIAKIKNATCEFRLEDSDLVDLKKAGVSPKVIAAMLEASALTAPRVTVDDEDVPIHTLGQAKVGGRLGHDVTFGIKSVKGKAYLGGPHSTIIASSNPLIEIALPKGDTIDNYILVQMDGKSDRREIEVEARGGVVGAKNGIRAEAIHKMYTTPLGGNKFRMNTDALKKGEYIIYVVGSPDSIRGIYGRGYDFSVQGLEKRVTVNVTKQPVVIKRTPLSPPDPPTVAARVSESPTDTSTALNDESLIGVRFSGSPTARHDGIEVAGVEPNGPADKIEIKTAFVLLSGLVRPYPIALRIPP